MAGKDISIRAQNIYKRTGTTGYFSTTGNILLNAKNSVGAAKNPILIGNTANKSAGLEAYGKGIYVKGVNAGMLTLGDVIGTTFSASSEGSIAQADDKFIKADNIEVTATNDITLDNASNLIKAATITGGENVKLSSAARGGLKLEGLKVSGNADIISKRALKLTGNIESGKDMALTAGTDLSSSKSSTLKTGNNITLKAKNVKLMGKVETPYKKMTSDKVEDLKKFLKEMPVIMVTTNKGLDMRNEANSFDGVYVNSNGKQINGSVLITGNSPEFLAVIDKAVLNDITLTNSNGAIILLDKGALKSNKGSITLDISGDFSAGAALWAKKNINITSSNGSVSIAKLSTLEGTKTTNSENNETLKAGTDINLAIDKGDLTIEGKLRAQNGAITIKLNEGKIYIGNETTKENNEKVVIANRDITMTTDNGTIDILGNVESVAGNMNIKAQKPASENASSNVIENADVIGENIADILIDAELKANESIWITTDDGDIEVDEKITVTNGNVTIATADGEIVINSNGAEDMIRAQNDLNIETLNGAVTIAGKIMTKDGDIKITSNHETYARRQKGITVEETGAINPGRNLYLNATNGSIEFKNVAAKNADVKTINGDVTAETISADDTIAIELEHGNLYLNLAQSKGVAILTDDNSESSVNTIRANSVDVSDAVKVGRILPYYSGSSSVNYQSAASSGYSGYSSYSNGYSNFANSSNFASNRNSYAILGSTYTNNGLTYWQSATSSAAPNYSFSEFASLTDDISYMQTRNYFEVRFIPTWLESEFMDIDYSFDNFGIRNATEDELTID